MKLLTRYISILLAVAALTFAGCTKEGAAGTDVPGGDVSDGYMSVSVSLASSTRSYTGDIIEGMEHEMMVTSARLVIYSDGVAALVHDFADISNVSEDGISLHYRFAGRDVLKSENPYEFTTVAVDLAAKGVKLGGNCYAFMALNPGPRLKAATEQGKAISELESAVEYSPEEFMGEDMNRFMMNNATGLIPINKSVHIQSTPQKALYNPLRIPMMRGVSMICVSIGNVSQPQSAAGQTTVDEVPEYLWMRSGPALGFDGNPRNVEFLAKTSDLRWGMNVVNKKSYWLRKPTYDKYGDMEEMGYGYGYYPGYVYAEDPNFQGLSYFSGGSQAEREQNFTYLKDGSSLTLELTPTINSEPVFDYEGRNVNYVYVPENTMAPSDQYSDVATSVAVKVNVLPYPAALPSDDTMPSPVGKHYFECWFDFAGNGYLDRIPFLEEDINEYLKSVYKVINDGGELAKYINLNNPINEEVARSMWLEPVVNYLKEHGWDGAADPDWDNMESFKIGEFGFYRGGEMYYNTAIEHFDNSSYYGDAGLGVVRNGIYHVVYRPTFLRTGTIKPDVPGSAWDAVKIFSSSWYVIDTYFEIKKPVS